MERPILSHVFDDMYNISIVTDDSVLLVSIVLETVPRQIFTATSTPLLPLNKNVWNAKMKIAMNVSNQSYRFIIDNIPSQMHDLNMTNKNQTRYLICGNLGNLTSFTNPIVDPNYTFNSFMEQKDLYDSLFVLGNIAYYYVLNTNSTTGVNGLKFLEYLYLGLKGEKSFNMVAGNLEYYNNPSDGNQSVLPWNLAASLQGPLLVSDTTLFIPEIPLVAETKYLTDIGNFVYDDGPVRIIGINTEAFQGNHNPLYQNTIILDEAFIIVKNFLRDALAETDRKKTPWICVMGSRPPFYNTEQPFSDVNNMSSSKASQLMDILNEFKVNFYFCGHVRGYVFIHPSLNNQRLKYTTLILSGNAGDEKPLVSKDILANIQPFALTTDNTTDIQYGLYGYGIFNATKHNFDWNTFINLDLNGSNFQPNKQNHSVCFVINDDYTHSIIPCIDQQIPITFVPPFFPSMPPRITNHNDAIDTWIIVIFILSILLLVCAAYFVWFYL
jgi:hypothetical protein